ncbi:MAG: hypothetical protein QOF30_206 [Acidimicrobiaceae bacterium]|jgi:hypothetical protein|nr:hypothetical protein [Acidimicrobiaceae bacterium]
MSVAADVGAGAHAYGDLSITGRSARAEGAFFDHPEPRTERGYDGS